MKRSLTQASRRSFLKAAASLPAVGYVSSAFGLTAGDAAVYVAPDSPRSVVSFNVEWKFLRDEAEGAEKVTFDDVAWASVSTPHTFNDVDSFRTLISHGGGDRGTYKGIAWYRKHFTLPEELKGRHLFLEFEGMRQAGEIFLNGEAIGLYENGVTAYGVDISKAALFGKPNVLAVKVDNRTSYAERASGTSFQWNSNDFNPSFGGINRHVWLHVTGPVYQTLPLYYGLETSGVYVWGEEFDLVKGSCQVGLEAEVKNSLPDRATVELSAVVVDAKGQVCAELDGNSVDMVAGEKTAISCSGRLNSAHFWSPEDPVMYDVYSILKVEGEVVDVTKVSTGFRKVAFAGGAGKGGVHINDKFVYLKGFAQRSTDEWAGLGQAYPDWMHRFNAEMMRASNANYVRWMHTAPQKVDADACARAGIVQVCPAGDKESDSTGRRWEQRLEVMRDSMIYFRNNPSILFWEAGNTVISPEHMEAMVALGKEWDAHGGRPVGARGNDNTQANTAITPLAGYFGVMLGQDARLDQLHGAGEMFRGYSAARRDRAPIIETEDFREEGARRYWDNDSPPYYGFHKGPNDTYEFTSETFALAGVRRYCEYYANRISNTDPEHARWSGYASIYFSDSDADGRQDSSEVARVSGKVDAVRLPKQIYFATRVFQNAMPDVHVLGHWSYPVERKVSKSIFVIANTGEVELFVNGRSLGRKSKPESGYIFEFEKVAFAPGTLRAVALLNGKPVVEHTLTTADAPARVVLKPIVGPGGLKADGADVALFDVEIVDAKGRRCPTEDRRVDFAVSGPAVWRGGYNSGKLDSTNNLWLNTELGINRVAVRATLQAGEIVLTAKCAGLEAATVSVKSRTLTGVERGL